MFKSLLEQTDALVGYDPRSLSPDAWEKAVGMLTGLLSDRMGLLQDFAEAALGPSVFEGATFRYFWSREAMGTVCQGRLCPPGAGVEEKHQEFYPLPGLQLSAYLQPAFKQENRMERPPVVGLQCEVHGDCEREKVKDLFDDYRQHFRELVKGVPLDFYSSVGFDQVDRCRSTDPTRKLDVYFKQDDPEKHFWLEAAFVRTSPEQIVIRSFLILSALYDSFRQCLRTHGDRDQIVRYAEFLGR